MAVNNPALTSAGLIRITGGSIFLATLSFGSWATGVILDQMTFLAIGALMAVATFVFYRSARPEIELVSEEALVVAVIRSLRKQGLFVACDRSITTAEALEEAVSEVSDQLSADRLRVGRIVSAVWENAVVPAHLPTDWRIG